jgi:hypothetical protein
MPSHLRDGVISLLYVLFLPAWCHLGREDGPLILSGDDTTRGIAFRGLCGPPGAERVAFSAELRLEDLACSELADLYGLWRLVVTTMAEGDAPEDEGGA